jgi:hypothetical protein
MAPPTRPALLGGEAQDNAVDSILASPCRADALGNPGGSDRDHSTRRNGPGPWRAQARLRKARSRPSRGSAGPPMTNSSRLEGRPDQANGDPTEARSEAPECLRQPAPRRRDRQDCLTRAEPGRPRSGWPAATPQPPGRLAGAGLVVGGSDRFGLGRAPLPQPDAEQGHRADDQELLPRNVSLWSRRVSVTTSSSAGP